MSNLYQNPYQPQNPYGNSQPYSIRQNPIGYQNDQYGASMNPNNMQGYIPPTMNPPISSYGYNYNNNYIKCRPVASIDEARASQVDLDGSLNVFTDIGNKKIYTKQINLDGTATLNTYTLLTEVEQPPIEYVTKAEFESVVRELQNLLAVQQQHPAPAQEKISF